MRYLFIKATNWKMKRLTRTDIENMVSEAINHLINEGYIPGMTFITYGKGNKFDRSKFKFIPKKNAANPLINKPQGLWACPLKDSGGSDWDEFIVYNWDEQSHTLENHFIFKLSSNANICIIDSKEKLKELPWKEYYGITVVDWDLVKRQYDAVFVDKKIIHMPEFPKIPSFRLWDVESICVFNPDIIEPIDESPEEFTHNSGNWKERLNNLPEDW